MVIDPRASSKLRADTAIVLRYMHNETAADLVIALINMAICEGVSIGIDQGKEVFDAVMEKTFGPVRTV